MQAKQGPNFNIHLLIKIFVVCIVNTDEDFFCLFFKVQTLKKKNQNVSVYFTYFLHSYSLLRSGQSNNYIYIQGWNFKWKSVRFCRYEQTGVIQPLLKEQTNKRKTYLKSIHILLHHM